MPHNLLIADDSVTIQRVIKLTFADEDVDVVAVGDGSQALAAIDKAPPDIVLADVEMPGCSGYDVARHVRSSPRLSHIPVVLLTGAFEPVDEAKASAVGCDGVLAKPFEPQAVLARVRELLSKPRKAESTAPTPPVAPAPPHAVLEPAVPVAPPKPAQNLDAYFDRLDQAFADLATSPRVPTSAPVAADAAKDLNSVAAGFGAGPSSLSVPGEAPTPRPSAPLAFSSLRVTRDRPSEPEPPAPPSVPAASARVNDPLPEIPNIRSSRPGVKSLVEAFQGLIAEEQAEPAAPQEPPRTVASTSSLAGVAPAPPRPMATSLPESAAAKVPALSDEVIDQIATRVMDRLAAKVANGNVADVVSRIAETLVREEIDLIKRRL